MTNGRDDGDERRDEPLADSVPPKESPAADASPTPVDNEAAGDSGGSAAAEPPGGTDDAAPADATEPGTEDVDRADEPGTGGTDGADEMGTDGANEPGTDGANEPGTDKPAAATTQNEAAAESEAGPGWRRLIAGLFTVKLNAASLIIALLIGLLGFALIAQVHSNANESTLANDRPDDLVRILSDLDARKDRLSTEISSLQGTVRQLNSGAQSRQAALDAAAKRGDDLGILGGTLPAKGPGLAINLIPATNRQISADRVLDTIEELRGAGAEAMQINGTGSSAVRIVASTYFVDGAGGVDVDGRTIGGTLTVTVIGDPQTMQAALSIAGGVVDSVRSDGGTVQVDTPGSVQVTALHAAQALRFAKPVS